MLGEKVKLSGFFVCLFLAISVKNRPLVLERKVGIQQVGKVKLSIYFKNAYNIIAMVF